MKFTIDHPMPTSEQMRAEMQRKLDAGEPLGASHVPTIRPGVHVAGSTQFGGINYLNPSDKPRWPCRGETK